MSELKIYLAFKCYNGLNEYCVRAAVLECLREHTGSSIRSHNLVVYTDIAEKPGSE